MSHPPDLSSGQSLALKQLKELASEGRSIQLVGPSDACDAQGSLHVQVSIDCAKTPYANGGLRLRQRERFVVAIPRGFPFEIPMVITPHLKWAGYPHIQWGSLICLYAAPSVEWVAADGMFGLVDRLIAWMERAALGDLDRDDLPLHPPLAYAQADADVMVVRADLAERAPAATDNGRLRQGALPKGQDMPKPRFVVGVCEGHKHGRFDVVQWLEPQDWLQQSANGAVPAQRNGRPVFGLLAILNEREMTFEYPDNVVSLLDALGGLGSSRGDIFTTLGDIHFGNIRLAIALAASTATEVQPPNLYLAIGTPSRRSMTGPLRQHLVCWRLDTLGQQIALKVMALNAMEHSDEWTNQVVSEASSWVEGAPTTWVQVMEDRAEVTARRDTGSAVEWLRDRRVLILGCGALGAPVAEFCVRAGAQAVTVVDNGIVSPGILVRQPYFDFNIGRPKAKALAARLNSIRTDKPVTPIFGSVERSVLADSAVPDFDLVIDATADATVSAMLELRRSEQRAAWPPVLSIMIGHDARRGLLTLAKMGASGGGKDILRRLSLAGRRRRDPRFHDVLADFFPLEPRTRTFQPEPGCSSPTFTGSAAELAALAGHLLDAGLQGLLSDGSLETSQDMLAAALRLDAAAGPGLPGVTWFGWANDLVVPDAESGYQVRMSQIALATMRAEVRRGARIRDTNCETGGLLLGQVDDACRCIWVDEVSGPPPDSWLSAFHFDHGTEGVQELVAYHRERSGRLTGYLGMWHSHPRHEASPSRTDQVAMRTLVAPLKDGPRRALMIIVGGDDVRWKAWVEGDQAPDFFARLGRRSDQTGVVDVALPAPAAHLTGGWSASWRPPRPPNTRKGRPLRRRARRRRRST